MIRIVSPRNFRGFEHLEINFRPGINLFIGVNGSGKTSVLKACQYALGTFFCGFARSDGKMPKFTELTPRGSDFMEKFSDQGETLFPEAIEIEFSVEYEGYKIDHQKLRKNSPSGNRALITTFPQLREYSRNLLEQYSAKEGRRRPLPLFAYYSTVDIHSYRRISYDNFIDLKPRADFGYFNSLSDENAFLDYWHKRMLVLKEAGEGDLELNVVEKTVKKVLGEEGCNIFSDYEIRVNAKKVFYKLTDGRTVDVNLLSDGHKRILNIVIDMAFRATILNGFLYGEDAAEKTEGTILIDEIDMHLHPSLQSSILRNLSKAFPQMQFIVTTHAPMVMSGVDNREENKNVVYQIAYKEGEYVLNEKKTFGLDSSTILEDLLSVPPREIGTHNRLEKLFEDIDNENIEGAKELLEEMRVQFGARLPELTRAETLLAFILSDNEED